MLKRIRKYFSFYFDIPSVVIIFVLILLMHRPLANFFLEWISPYQQDVSWAGGAIAVVMAIFVNLVSALLIGLVAFWIFKVNRRSDTVGKFKAYDLTGGKKQEWGTLTLRYNFFSNRIVGRMKYEDIEMRLEGVMDRDQYFRGHYAETGNGARRRLGAFLMDLQGSGKGYDGQFVFVDPDHREPECGEVAWEKID